VVGYFYKDSINTSFQHKANYTYDALNRLGTGVATPVSPGTVNYNLTYSYDRFGNASCTGGTGLCTSMSFNTATNRITNSNFSYDSAGNLLQDGTGAGTHSYQWDAEGKMKSVDNGTTSTYTYNALGQLAQLTWATNYLTHPLIKR